MAKEAQLKEKFKEFKVYKDVFDRSTIAAIWKLITKDVFEGLESPIKLGKESNIFSALTAAGNRLAVKIYRIVACDFKNMWRYLAMDPRFRFKKSKRAIVLTWAKREFKNLNKAHSAGVAVPRPLIVNENVLVMEFIGTARKEQLPAPAPLLKDFCEKPVQIFTQLLQNVRLLYQKARLVHGDLSEYNILNLSGKPILIDLSHAVPASAPAAAELLERDVGNMCKFFNRLGLGLEKEKLLNEIKYKK